MLSFSLVLVSLCLLSSSPLNSNKSQTGLCNCLDAGWLVSHEYTPNGPTELEVKVATRTDESGQLHPVLDVKWKIQDEGSISYLNATELHVLEISTNDNLCVRYTFKDKLPMRNQRDEKWSFSADMVVVQPGQSYQVSVFNIPKPQPRHSVYDVKCRDPMMHMTKFCIESGSLWQPNITLTQTGHSALTVSFSSDRRSDQYTVICRCSSKSEPKYVSKADRGIHNVTFNLNDWPRPCCRFYVEIKPHFLQCGNDCTRQRKSLDICRLLPSASEIHVMPTSQCSFLFHSGLSGVGEPRPKIEDPPKEPPKVLIIYSHDHHLYKDIILKLSAFLQAKCGTRVLVDLLDSASVSMVGRVRWLEWQRQKLNPSDKILVLCSRGVQAKWRAMCGQGKVTLREDVRSPTDDMITPFLSLFLPDMHQPGRMGKYMVAYFDDISCEQDIPSVFDIAVKYRLMKHFEELYFRILDVEKYEPDRVKQIEGIGQEDYFTCPSGRDLRIAIETFQLYQLENPDWFETQCVDSEEEVMSESSRLIDELQIPPVREYVPVINEGPPVYCQGVMINQNVSSIHVFNPELNPHTDSSSVVEHTPIVNTEWNRPHPLNPDQRSPCCLGPESGFTVEPVLIGPPPSRQNWPSIDQQHIIQMPYEVQEEPSSYQSTPRSYPSGPPPPSMDFNWTHSSHTNSVQSEHLPLSETSRSQPVEMEEHETLETCGKRPSSGSDQGYMSRMSSQKEPTSEEESLKALRRLQEEQFNDNIKYSSIG
uniref:SEFIR domain-containing protein n=1 Tax=Sphaeramia orbicularis TaxID=375764 RepID=A0A672YXL7_9TELE